MLETVQLDIRIGSKDPAVVDAVTATLQPLNPSHLEQHRDLVTVLTVSAAAIKLAQSLIELWLSVKKLKDAPTVKVEAASGAQLDLAAVKTQREIEEFVANSGR